MKKTKVAKKTFKILSGFIIGSAVGSILGLTLAPKKGNEARQFIKDTSMEVYLAGKKAIQKKSEKKPLWKRIIIKVLSKKK